jgi:hypothetical protein
VSGVLPIQAAATVRSGSDNAGEAQAPESVSPAPALSASVIVNPTLRLDAGLGLVVIEFRNDTGDVTTSIPSQRQIEAYQRWAQTHAGPDPSAASTGAVTSAPVPAVVASEPSVPSHTGQPGTDEEKGTKRSH